MLRIAFHTPVGVAQFRIDIEMFRNFPTCLPHEEQIEIIRRTYLCSLHAQADARIDRVLIEARFWQRHRTQPFSAELIMVLNSLLDDSEKGLEASIGAAQYQAVSKATARGHLADLLEKGVLQRLTEGTAPASFFDLFHD